MSWSETEFEELYAIPSKNGLNRPSRVRGSGYKMINMGELFANDRIGEIDMEFVPMNDKEIATMLVEPGDLLFARQSLVLAGAGKCSLVMKADEPTTFESHIIRVRLKREIADPVYFHYYFKSPICHIRSIVTQGVQAGIRGNDLRKLKVHVPPVSEQARIASILSAYNDLIENNRRRIQLLEESARLLYREWFVRLRFPGPEHVKIIDGVPEGWEEGCVGDIVNVQSGYAFKSKEWQIEGNPVIKIKNIEDNSIELNNCQCVSQSVADKAQKFLLSGGDFLIAMTGATVGKVGIMPRTKKNYYLNQRVGIMRPIIQSKPTPFLFSFFNTENAQNQILNFAAGSAQPNISPTQIESIKLLLPKESLFKKYMEICNPLFSQRLILMEQNDKLKQARDLLLPRLMNGEIEV